MFPDEKSPKIPNGHPRLNSDANSFKGQQQYIVETPFFERFFTEILEIFRTSISSTLRSARFFLDFIRCFGRKLRKKAKQ